MNSYLVEQSMQIILKAGNARTECMTALDAIGNEDFETAWGKLESSNAMITEAHSIHTKVLQESVNNENVEYSVLFSHAQDTLMTIYSELILAKKMYAIFKSFHQRMEELEEKEKKEGL